MDRQVQSGVQITIHSTLLLGIVGGHFDMGASVMLPDQQEKLRVPVAAGIAVVLPAETVIEVLESEEQKKIRDKQDVRLLSATPLSD